MRSEANNYTAKFPEFITPVTKHPKHPNIYLKHDYLLTS